MWSFVGTRGGRLAMSLVLLSAVSADLAPPRAAQRLDDRVFFFRTRDGGVLALLELDFLAAREEVGGYTGAARVEEVVRKGGTGRGASPWTVPLQQTTPSVWPGRNAFYGRAYLESGKTYAVRYSVASASDDEIVLKTKRVVAPHLNGGFSASTVVPAESYGPAAVGAGPFQVGSEEVVPKPRGVFHRSEPLKLYLQVYDAVVDPETSQRRVDVVFRFFRTVKKSAKRQGKPYTVRNVGGASMGLALAIGDWPAGDYRVEVELYDRRSAARTTTQGSFSIAEH